MYFFLYLFLWNIIIIEKKKKRPKLGLADKYTTLIPLAWLIKPVFHLQIFSFEATFLLNSHWLATFFEIKKVRSNPTFYCF